MENLKLLQSRLYLISIICKMATNLGVRSVESYLSIYVTMRILISCYLCIHLMSLVHIAIAPDLSQIR
ncbi:hypothetical protein T07_10238 [Trichinella nelsoni]|uniref:Uncharacterized protein n=1 Tax=Trichinella nelsoni TaxID=6336 RepID=A0A0V0RHP5_9BILA|nr:hypothetical protein T07_10238 [Trichinella nelsoni]